MCMDTTVIANKIPNVQGGFSMVDIWELSRLVILRRYGKASKKGKQWCTYTLDTIVGGKAVSAMEVTRALYRDR